MDVDMSQSAARFTITLSNRDLMDLKMSLPDGSVGIPTASRVDPLRAGDLGLTAAIVILTPPVIHALAVWLAKRRTEESHEENIHVERDPDGSVRITVHRRSRGRTSSPPSAATVEALRAELTRLAEQVVGGS